MLGVVKLVTIFTYISFDGFILVEMASSCFCLRMPTVHGDYFSEDVAILLIVAMSFMEKQIMSATYNVNDVLKLYQLVPPEYQLSPSTKQIQ